jgi:hypothetical protein
MTKNPSLKGKKTEIKEIILEIVKKENLQNTHDLINIIQEKTGLTKNEITNILIELEKEYKLHFTRKQSPLKSSAISYILSKQATWYQITIAIAIATALSIFAISESSTIIFIRSALGAVFILFLPGYTIVRLLFQQKLPLVTNNESMDNIERFFLSIGLSIVLTMIVGLIFNYTPWGINLIPITLDLLTITIGFATLDILVEFQSKQIASQKKL